MTSLAQVTALVDAHHKRDWERFRAVTLQIAAQISAKSPRSAERLIKLVDNDVARSLVPLPSANGLLSTPHALPTFDEMVLATDIRNQLARLIDENECKRLLLEHGLFPARKFLFVGPPGVGKTMAAGAIANELGMPMFRVELHGVIGQYLGETASRLSKVFDHVRQMPAVYLFDEFDALALSRDGHGDGSSASNEMRRVVNSLLQFIEDDRSESLIVATTNYAKVIDPAMFRRFDDVVTFRPLDDQQVYQLLANAIPEHSIAANIGPKSIAATFPSLGHADLCAAIRAVRKAWVMNKTPITHETLCKAISDRVERHA